jgi:hypothetical protein
VKHGSSVSSFERRGLSFAPVPQFEASQVSLSLPQTGVGNVFVAWQAASRCSGGWIEPTRSQRKKRARARIGIENLTERE